MPPTVSDVAVISVLVSVAWSETGYPGLLAIGVRPCPFGKVMPGNCAYAQETVANVPAIQRLTNKARFMLGLGESGNFPAAIKTVAEWDDRIRAFTDGILA